MSDPLESYLRTYRKLSGFTQTEIAYLLQAESAQTVSRLERGEQVPDLVQAFSLEVVFGVPLEQLFAGIQRKARMQTQNRAYLLAKMLADEPESAEKSLKSQTLERIYRSALDEEP